MKTLSLPKPLQGALLTTVVLTAIALLEPEAVDMPTPQASSLGATSSQAPDTRHTGMPWVRTTAEPWRPTDTELLKTAEAVAPVLPDAPAPPVVEAPRPVAPDPSMVYLGHLEQDGRRYVFLGRGADPQVVEIGGLVDSQWQVEEATATEIRLRYLPLNEVRAIPIAAAQ